MAYNSTSTYESQPIAWGLPVYLKTTLGSIMNRGIDLGDTNNIPAMSNQYWNNMQGQALSGIAGSEQQAQNQLAEMMARRGLSGSGAEMQGMGDILRSGLGQRSNALTNLLGQRQQSDMSNYWQAQNLRNQIANLGLQTSARLQADKNAGAARGMARDRFDWSKKMDIMRLMQGMGSNNVGTNNSIFQNALQGYLQPQQIAFGSAG